MLGFKIYSGEYIYLVFSCFHLFLPARDEFWTVSLEEKNGDKMRIPVKTNHSFQFKNSQPFSVNGGQ